MPKLSAEQLFNTVCFTHTTCILPFGGVMTPGSKGVTGTMHPRLPIDPSRFTLHWFPHGLVKPHHNWIATPDQRFFIVEPSRYLQSSFYGGYGEDFISLGQHQLSEEAAIFAPNEDMLSVITQLYPGYKGQLYFYSTREEAHQLVANFIAKKSPDHQLTILPIEKVNVSIDLNELIRRVSVFEKSGQYYSEDMQYYQVKSLIAEAASRTPRPKEVTLEYEASFTELKVMHNGNQVSASDFFSSWGEKAGFFYGLHASSPFAKLEKMIRHCLTMAFSTPPEPIHESKIGEAMALVDVIQAFLQARKYPREILDYFEQKIKIDLLMYWLPTLIKLSRSAEPAVAKIEHLVDMTSSSTILSMRQIKKTPEYETSIIEKQVTAQLMTEYTGTFFRAHKRVGGALVDALTAESIKDKDARKHLQCALKKIGIPSYFTQEDRLVVPDINTSMVARAARNAFGL